MDNSLCISFTSFLSFFSSRETNNLRVIWNHTKLACIDTLYILEIYTYSTIIEKENKWFLLLEKALLPLFLCKCPILVFFFFFFFSFLFFFHYPFSFIFNFFFSPPCFSSLCLFLFLHLRFPQNLQTLCCKKRGKKIVELEKTIPENEMRENNGKGKYCLPAESFSFSLLVSLARWELTPIFSSIIFKFQTVQTISLFKVSSD